ncbi:MAG: hypothetical protein GF311_12815 [Candidatus Lokiarchaeota archaeon]|nr:hypothetical protein [Candidatus Lokiarchaeota archaeon]
MLFKIEDSEGIIKNCYEILRKGNYILNDIKSNKYNILYSIAGKYGYNLTKGRKTTIIKYFRIIFHIISNNRLLPKSSLAKKFDVSRKVIRRIFDVLESFNLNFDEKFSIATTFTADDLDSIMLYCYDLFCQRYVSIQHFEKDKDLIKNIITNDFKYNYNETRKELVINCFRFIYYLLSDDSNVIYKKDLIEKSGLSEPIIYRFLQHLEEKCCLDLRNRFYVPMQHKVNQFLDSKLEDINKLRYIPSLNQVIRDLGYDEVNSDHIAAWFKSRFSEGDISYEYLTDLKMDAGVIKSVPVYAFLDEKLIDIKNATFIPTVENIIQEREDLDFDILPSLVNSWLRQNNLPLISELQEKTGKTSYRKQLIKLLDIYKQQIINYEFLPTPENIIYLDEKFENFQWLSLYISRWLKRNKIAPNLTEYLYHNDIMSDTRRLREFFDSKLMQIKEGNYFPTIKNLRRDRDIIELDVDDLSVLNTVRADWFRNNLGMSMSQLIEELDPYYEDLGYDVQQYGYPAQFKHDKLRIFNAKFQIVTVANRNELISFNISKNFKTLKSLFRYLIKHNEWKFVDMLTGEIFNLKDLNKGGIILHHIDFEKENLDPDNLVYLFRDTHGFINAADRYNEVILDFISEILIKNIQSIKNCSIPESWKVGWRKLAINQGIDLPSTSYIKSKQRSRIIGDSSYYRKLGNF